MRHVPRPREPRRRERQDGPAAGRGRARPQRASQPRRTPLPRGRARRLGDRRGGRHVAALLDDERDPRHRPSRPARHGCLEPPRLPVAEEAARHRGERDSRIREGLSRALRRRRPRLHDRARDGGRRRGRACARLRAGRRLRDLVRCHRRPVPARPPSGARAHGDPRRRHAARRPHLRALGAERGALAPVDPLTLRDLAALRPGVPARPSRGVRDDGDPAPLARPSERRRDPPGGGRRRAAVAHTDALPAPPGYRGSPTAPPSATGIRSPSRWTKWGPAAWPRGS